MASSSPNDVNYFVRDEQGKVLKVLKHTEVKQESMNRSVTSFSDNSALIEHSELKSTRHVKMTNTYKLQYTENNFGVIIGREETSANNEKHHIQLQPVKYGPSCAEGKHSVSHSSNKCEGKIQRSIINHKSKAHTNTLSLQRKRKPEKAGKGLRHFSMKVCEKVKEKGATTYNEVADELVTEEIQNQSYDSANCDQKNIRRRVYDALNVLMAMNIISKDKKEIRWIGLPTNSVEKYSALEKENKKRRERIEAKHQQLRELILQQVSFRSLVERNKEAERKCIIPTPNSSIQLPFIIVNTHKSTKINCSVTNDKSEYIFKFDDKFEMHDDAEVLKRMGLLLGLDKGTCTCADIERAKLLVPKNFVKYIEAYGRGEGLNTESRKEISSYIGLPSEPHDFLRRKCGQLPDMRDDTFLDESD